MVNIYDYFDYRKLLKDIYEEKKLTNPHFSYRYIGQKAGFTSAGFFTKILQGKCNISLPMTLRLAEVFKFKKHEAEYFELLVHFNQAKSQGDKKHFFDKLLSIKKSKVRTLETGQYDLFSEWYYIAIREILDFYLFKDDYKELARMVVPPVSPAEAKKAVEVLESLGLIRINPYGFYERADAVLSTGDQWQSVVIAAYQQRMLDLAKQSYDLFPREKRDMSTLTLSISAESFRVIREKLSQLRREILEVAKNERSADRVYQINFQAWPLSRIEEKP